MDKIDMKAKLILLARKNYNNGGDAMIECWDDADYVDFIEENGENSEKELLELMGILEDRQKEHDAESRHGCPVDTVEETKTQYDENDDEGRHWRMIAAADETSQNLRG